MIIRRRFQVRGIVQGVGFRPFVYRLAVRNRLNGWVLNDNFGVTIEVEGEEEGIDTFMKGIKSEAPPLSMIISVGFEKIPILRETGFEIRLSQKKDSTATLISPDIGVCDQCIREMKNPGDRRYRYPFINCTNCGPRYTIMENIPYDRPSTSMKHFTMCASCAEEYHNPLSRRFHAQPNACPVCGPRLIFLDGDGNEMLSVQDPVLETVKRLKAGMIAAIKGLGGFHLAVDATSQEAVLKLRERKNREEKPMAIMVSGIETAALLVHLSAGEAAELESPRKPIILARKKKDNPVAPAVSPFNDYLGVMLPYTPLHHLLFTKGEMMALVMTSGNLSEEPICIDNEEAVQRLKNIADFYLMHDRIIYLRSDDSVVRFLNEKTYPLRRSRGYAPAPVILDRPMKPVMGLGAELKNTVCLAKGNLAFLSQYIGDMANEETYSFFLKTVGHLEKILECEAELLAYDLHPDYLATRYALEQKDKPKVGVQHHHAHAVSCMAEHHLRGPVLAVTFDGTGYGMDGHIWGGEFLVAELAGFRRAAHLLEIPMPGGDAAIREPYRMAVSYLYALYGNDLHNKAENFLGRFPAENIDVLVSMIDRRINVQPTSSAGRLFDCVSSLLGIRDRITFEGQAAMELESFSTDEEDSGAYKFEVDSAVETMVINTLPIIEDIMSDIKNGFDLSIIASRFHQTLAAVIRKVIVDLRDREGIDKVVLSGGVFQNVNLLKRVLKLLEKEDLMVYHHEKVPANDGGICLGQAVIAHERYF